jgi:hypothetical protein
MSSQEKPPVGITHPVQEFAMEWLPTPPGGWPKKSDEPFDYAILYHDGTCKPHSTSDGRPFSPGLFPDSDPALLAPDPPRDGDPVYCLGARAGTFHGNAAVDGEWWIDLDRSRDLPLALAHALAAVQTFGCTRVGHSFTNR